MYQFLIRLISPLVVILIAYQAVKKQGGWRFLRERLGLSYQHNPNHQEKPTWIHCASVGEVSAAEPIIQHHLNRYPNRPIVVTTNTVTGKDHIQRLFPSQIEHVYCPVDWPYAIKRFLKAYQPARLWVMETEIWPNLYDISHSKQIPIEIFNARLSKKTLSAPRWLKDTYRLTLAKVNHVSARSEKEAGRFRSLGVHHNRIKVTGNTKYAHLLNVARHARPIERTYIVVASTHNPEELEITKQWLSLQRDELLVIIPRHPERMKKIREQLQTLDIDLKIASLNQQPTADTQVYLVDQIGKLMPLFEHAQLVIMGGSFVEKGGHNILEPAAYGKAIITGMDMSDYHQEMALFMQHSAILQADSYEDLACKSAKYLNDKLLCEALGQQARSVIEEQAKTISNYIDSI